MVPLPESMGDDPEPLVCAYCGGDFKPSWTESIDFCSEACGLLNGLDVRGVLLQQVKLNILHKNERAAAFSAKALVSFCRAWEASDIREALL
jgi:hypothetical protein